MSRRYRVMAPERFAASPVLWAARRAFDDAFWVESSAEHEAVVAVAESCSEAVGTPGIFLAPPLEAPGLVEALNANHPVLVIGSPGIGGWAPALAARLRCEVLQVARIGADLEVAGDLAGSIQVLARLATRFEAVVAKLG
jgi:hypothetical protein